jgi:hypothetical protein
MNSERVSILRGFCSLPPYFRLPYFLLLAQLFVISVAAQDRPLQTPDTQTVPAGTLRAEVGFDFLQGINFPVSGLTGDLTSVANLDLRMGVGRIVEVQLEGAVQNFLDVKHQVPGITPIVLTALNSTHDVGDFSLYTKVRIWSESPRRPALAIRFGYMIPNSNQARGISTNTTNIFASLILQKHFWRLNTFGTAGVAILQAPGGTFSQNDVLTYGAAFIFPLHKRVNLAGEVYGRYNSRKITPVLTGTESRAQARGGFQIFAGGFQWDVAGIAGLTKRDASSGFTFGLSRDVRLFDFGKLK